MSLYNELKRRNVLRVGAAYIVAAWLIIQVVETIFPAFGFGDSAIRIVVIVLAITFIPSLVLSWVFEITPEGMKREVDVVRDDSTTYVTGKRLDRIIMVLLALALGYFAFDKFVLDPVRDDLIVETAHQEGRSEALVESFGDKSIAVLAFVNMSDDAGNEYFSDGISEEILNLLTKIPELRVISRSSAFSFKGKETQIPEIAKILNVAHILEGSVRKAGNQVRITAQLIDARSDTHLWSETYDRQLLATNIFAIQSEIAEAIAQTLRMTLSPREQQRIRSVPTESFAAYEAYLIGKQSMEKRTKESLAGAEEYFRQALELDPRYALAWVGLANTYMFQVLYSGLPERENFGKAKAAIDTALELDRDLGEAYASLGLWKQYMKDLEGAEQAYKQALELSPNYAMGHRWYSGLLADLGRWEERLVRVETAIQLDPLSTNIRYNYANALREIGRGEEALEQLEITLEINPEAVAVYYPMAAIQWQLLNRLDMAAQTYAKAINHHTKQPWYYIWLAQLYLDLGEPERASLLLDRVNELVPEDPIWLPLLLHLYQQTTEGMAEDARAILADPTWDPFSLQFSAAQLRNLAMAEGRHDEALAVYSKYQPQLLLEHEPSIDLNDYRDAIDLSLVLQIVGDQERASMLLERSKAFIEEQSTIPWFGGYWISNVQILALQGRKAEALAALRLAVDEGWRTLWWYYLQYDPNLESIRDEPKFQAILAEIKADMSAQMQRIREMEQSGEIETVPGVIFEPK